MTSNSHIWPVDGHVHFHSRTRVGPTLDAAGEHFRAVHGRSDGLLGALLLAQGAGEQVFEALRDTPSAGQWTCTAAREEPETIIARRGGAALAIVCGRQVRAADGLEVLALGTLNEFSDGLQFAATVDNVRRSGALTVLPWGFGKWLGDRGRRIEAMLDTMGPELLFVGDNGSRLALLGPPSLVQASERKGFRILPGTDPFPFAGGHGRVGQFGFLADIEPGEAAPWRVLRDWLMARTVSPRRYGRATGPLAFVFNQVGIQVYNRLFRKSSA